jgi:hypothetical protein
MGKPATAMKPFKVKHCTGTGKLVQKQALANSKVLSENEIVWIERHGRLSQGSNSVHIARAVFAMIDVEGKGEITGEAFCKFLIEVGILIDYKTLQKFIMQYKRVSHSENVALMCEDISNLCRDDHRTNVILGALMQGLDFSGKKQAVSILALFTEMQSWWAELDPQGYNHVHCNEVCALLVAKGATFDFNEAHKLAAKHAIESFFDFSSFTLIFARSLIKHLLLTIKDKFTENDWENPDFSYSYKLCQLKKQIILAGIYYPVPNISLEEGLAALEALQKYLRFIKLENLKVSYEEFCKIWLELTGEYLGKERLKAEAEKIEHQTTSEINSITLKAKNRFTVFGNLGKPNYGMWKHSFSPRSDADMVKTPINLDEVRCINQTKLLRQFNSIICHNTP